MTAGEADGSGAAETPAGVTEGLRRWHHRSHGPDPPRAAPPTLTSVGGVPCPQARLERLDLMLLAVEALDLNGGEAMVWMSEQLGFSGLFPNRVELWKRRCHNPLRRTTRRGFARRGRDRCPDPHPLRPGGSALPDAALPCSPRRNRRR